MILVRNVCVTFGLFIRNNVLELFFCRLSPLFFPFEVAFFGKRIRCLECGYQIRTRRKAGRLRTKIFQQPQDQEGEKNMPNLYQDSKDGETKNPDTSTRHSIYVYRTNSDGTKVRGSADLDPQNFDDWNKSLKVPIVFKELPKRK